MKEEHFWFRWRQDELLSLAERLWKTSSGNIHQTSLDSGVLRKLFSVQAELYISLYRFSVSAVFFGVLGLSILSSFAPLLLFCLFSSGYYDVDENI